MYCAAGTQINRKKNKQQLYLYSTIIKIVTLIIKSLHGFLLQYYLKIYTETFCSFKKYYSLKISFEVYSYIFCLLYYLKNIPKFIFELKYLTHYV